MSDSMDVEVPINGTVVVQNGEVSDVSESIPVFDWCHCSDGKHNRFFWNRGLDHGRKGVDPHPIGIQKFELVWEVRK